MTTAELTVKVAELEDYIKILAAALFGFDPSTTATVDDLVRFAD